MLPTVHPLLRLLLELLPQIAVWLDDPELWRGWLVGSPASGGAYERLNTRALLQCASVDDPRRYLVSVHAFEAHWGAMHDHRYPLAVFPMAVLGERGVVLYEMPWERRLWRWPLRSGVVSVRSGEGYAIPAASGLFHAVRSVQPHLSVVLSDESAGPARANRLPTHPLDADRVHVLRRQVGSALRAVISP